MEENRTEVLKQKEEAILKEVEVRGASYFDFSDIEVLIMPALFNGNAIDRRSLALAPAVIGF